MPAQKNSVTTKQIVDVLTPSAMSSVMCVAISLALSLSVIFISRYKSSSLRLQYQYYQAHHTIANSNLSGSILNNSLLRNLPLIGFWAIVGAVVYLVAANFVKAIRSAIELRKELDYVHVHRNLLIRNIFIQLGIIATVIIISLPYLSFFFHHILAYCVKLSIFATTASNTLLVAFYVVSAILVLSLALHAILVLVRLLFLKSRLFTYSVDE